AVAPAAGPLPANLHLLHSWGGGLERWVRLFAAADRRSRNLVLSSHGTRDAYGLELVLWDAASALELGRWVLSEAICEVAVRNAEYLALLASLVTEHRLAHLYVSSLIGHAVDALDLGLPTTVVHHDFFPFCPALNLYFGATCQSCGAGELTACLAANPYSELFRENPPEHWLDLRERSLALLASRGTTHVCPRPWVRDAFHRIDGRFAALPWTVVEHGIDGEPVDCFGGAEPGRRLRLLHLGRLNRYKGLDRLRKLLPELCRRAELTLLGTGPAGEELAGFPGVEVIEEYRPEELTALLRRLRPDLALFLSVVPETYCFTLSEAFLRGIPAVARRLGALAERIEPGRSGLLFDTDEECLEHLATLDRTRPHLQSMSRHLRSLSPRTAGEMVADYYRLRGE
ncbi:MAG TPA: glycosyltransferase, partial [Thermoanaerobaculia bacterium]|nr:glycosyltransferase [Thermoanaerobaculia bacterium]